MANAATAQDPGLNWGERVQAWFLSNEVIRGYSLLSPTLIVMVFGLCVPFGILVTMSFWTQHAFEFDTTLSLANYKIAFDRPMYGALLTR